MKRTILVTTVTDNAGHETLIYGNFRPAALIKMGYTIVNSECKKYSISDEEIVKYGTEVTE